MTVCSRGRSRWYAGPGLPFDRPRRVSRGTRTLLPGLVAHRLPTPASVDWPRLESVLGTALPADYKLLCELYPTFELSDFLRVGGPAPGAEAAWAEDTEDLEVLAEWLEDADLPVPMHPYPAPGGLLPWSSFNQGNFFLWTTSPAGPAGIGRSPSPRAMVRGGTTPVGRCSSLPIW